MLVLVVLAARVAWHASHATVGWEVIGHGWGRTLAALFHMDKPVLFERDPEEQAQFWLDEIDRLGQESQSADVAAGAAWMLDSPDAGFWPHFYRTDPSGAVGVDTDAASSAIDRSFEGKCTDRRRQLIEHARPFPISSSKL